MTAHVQRRYLIGTIVFAALDIVIALSLIFYKPSNISYKLPSLPTISISNVDELVVKRPSNTLSLKRSGNNWEILPGNYLADPGIATSMINAIADIKLTDVIATSGDVSRYDLGTNGRLAVSLVSKGKTLRTVYLGKRSSTYNHTYVQVPNDKRVFQAAGELNFMFEQAADNYRYKRVLSFDPASITSVALSDAGKRATVTRSSKGVWSNGSGKSVPTGTVTALLKPLSQLNAYAYRYDSTALKDPVATVDLSAGQNSYSLKLYKATGNQYPAEASGTKDSFYLMQYTGDNLISQIDGVISPK